jgi:hypothetical protein
VRGRLTAGRGRRAGSMRLVHLLIDPGLCPMFLSLEDRAGGAAVSSKQSFPAPTNLTLAPAPATATAPAPASATGPTVGLGLDRVGRFWARAAARFNDEEWRPASLHPADPHLARCSPARKSKAPAPAPAPPPLLRAPPPPSLPPVQIGHVSSIPPY